MQANQSSLPCPFHHGVQRLLIKNCVLMAIEEPGTEVINRAGIPIEGDEPVDKCLLSYVLQVVGARRQMQGKRIAADGDPVVALELLCQPVRPVLGAAERDDAADLAALDQLRQQGDLLLGENREERLRDPRGGRLLLLDLHRHRREQEIEIKGALSVDYGQKHRVELIKAASICRDLQLNHRVIDLSALRELFGSSSLTSPVQPVPDGHYQAEGMKATVVPNRNMILLSVATAWAISLGAEAVAYAAHSGDHAIYPDCREVFADALDQAIRLCDWSSVFLYRPFVDLDKTAIARLGGRLGVPFETTWSCYKGNALHCGRCGTCVERREAFFLAGLEDPTRYAADAPSVATLTRSGWKL